MLTACGADHFKEFHHHQELVIMLKEVVEQDTEDMDPEVMEVAALQAQPSRHRPGSLTPR